MSKRKPKRVPPLRCNSDGVPMRTRDGVLIGVIQEWQMVRHSTLEVLREFAPDVDSAAFERRVHQHFAEHTERLLNYVARLKAGADA